MDESAAGWETAGTWVWFVIVFVVTYVVTDVALYLTAGDPDENALDGWGDTR